MEPVEQKSDSEKILELKELLHELISDAQGLARPSVDCVYPFSECLSKLSERTKSYDPILTVGVVGQAGVGKTTILNALLGNSMIPVLSETSKSAKGVSALDIRHREAREPYLTIRKTGKIISYGVEDTKERLYGLLALRANHPARRGSAVFRPDATPTPDPLRLEMSIPCLASQKPTGPMMVLFEETITAPVVKNPKEGPFPPSPRDTDYVQPLVVHHTIADVMIFVLDFAKLGTAEEKGEFDAVVKEWPTTLTDRKCDRVLVLVNKSELLLFPEQSGITVDNPNPPKCPWPSIESVQVHIRDQLLKRSVVIEMDQIAVISAKFAESAHVLTFAANENIPTIKQIYDFAELALGPWFMQQIDSVTDVDLRRTMRLRAEYIHKDSHFGELDSFLQSVHQETGRNYISALIAEFNRHLTRFLDALHQSDVMFGRAKRIHTEELTTLDAEFKRVAQHRKHVSSMLRKINDQTGVILGDLFHEFFLQRVEELIAVMEGEDETYFKNRQCGAIYDIICGLRQFVKFLPQYHSHRLHMLETAPKFAAATPLALPAAPTTQETSRKQLTFADEATLEEASAVGDGTVSVRGSARLTAGVGGELVVREEKEEEAAVSSPSEAAMSVTTVDPTLVESLQLMDGTARRFVEAQHEDILRLLEERRIDCIMKFNSAVVAHVKDELEVFLPMAEEFLLEMRRKAVEELLQYGQPVWEQTQQTARLPPFDAAGLTLDICEGMRVLEFNRQDTNNAMRRAVEEVGELLLCQPSTATIPDQCRTVLNSWRLYFNRADPYELIHFRQSEMAQAIEHGVAQLRQFFGAYEAMLFSGINQIKGDIATIETSVADAELLKAKLPAVQEKCDGLLQQLPPKAASTGMSTSETAVG